MGSLEEEPKERQREVKRSDKWDLDIADLLEEEEKKQPQPNKKHLLLFDEEDLE